MEITPKNLLRRHKCIFFPYVRVSNGSSGRLGVTGEETELCSINLQHVAHIQLAWTAAK